MNHHTITDMLRYLLFAINFIFLVSLTVAQSGIIRGTVYEESTGEPLFGVAVRIAGTTNGGISDFDGKFQINAEPGTYDLEASFISFKTVKITGLVVEAGEVTLIDAIWMQDAVEELEAVIVTAEVIKNSESALLTVKRKSANVLDGISSESFRKIGDANAGEAAKRVTGVSVEGGKYVYVRGLGDRYTKTTLNGLDIPGLDPDRNSIQIDIFPTNLIDNIVIVKSFTPELPADFTGGLVNIETKDFPEEKIFDVSASIGYNPAQHFNSDFLDSNRGDFDFLGFDDGTRRLPGNARQEDIPFPNANPDQEVNGFLNQFSPALGAEERTSFLDYSLGVTYGDQKELKNGNSLGFLFSGNYKNSTVFYDEAFFGEAVNAPNRDEIDFRVASTLNGALGERKVLLAGLAGLAYKTATSKYKLNILHLQNGERRAGQFNVINSDDIQGFSDFAGFADNLEYNERRVSNVFLNGEHFFNESGWSVDWRVSSTWSSQDDPDIRNTTFTIAGPGNLVFSSGAGGLPTRIWRELDEVNVSGKTDVVKEYDFSGQQAKLKFGVSHTYKQRDFRIFDFNLRITGDQSGFNGDPNQVFVPGNLFPNGGVSLTSGFTEPSSNEYEASINNTGFYVSNEFSFLEKFKSIVGVRGENFIQRHTGRSQNAALDPAGNPDEILDNDIVLNSLDFFPSVNLIYSIAEKQSIRGSYSRTIARPSFKELSFAQILDPVSQRTFNGALFGGRTLNETRINNFDLRWELFLPEGQLLSVSGFYKTFDDPIELVRLAASQTGREIQPQNVGDGQLFGLELEFRKSLGFITPALAAFSINGNVTLVESIVDISPDELQSRENNRRTDEDIDDTRNLAGQSPWIVNAGLSYNNSALLLDAGLFYNVRGETLTIVGGGTIPDVFTEPFHSLNFNLNKTLGAEENMAINFSVTNILADKQELFFQRDGATDSLFGSLNPGVSIGLGFKYSF